MAWPSKFEEVGPQVEQYSLEINLKSKSIIGNAERHVWNYCLQFL